MKTGWVASTMRLSNPGSLVWSALGPGRMRNARKRLEPMRGETQGVRGVPPNRQCCPDPMILTTNSG
jgi:hypothetical protein